MDDRSARLAALAAKAGRSSQQTSIDGGGHDQEDASSSKPTITIRNYVPKDQSLDKLDAEILSSNKRQKRSTSEKTTKPTALELALAKTSRESQAAGQNVGTNGGWGSPVATKKVNWDLRRDVQHRLDRLEKRTQRAIVKLLRERLEREAGEVANDDDEGEGDSDLD